MKRLIISLFLSACLTGCVSAAQKQLIRQSGENLKRLKSKVVEGLRLQGEKSNRNKALVENDIGLYLDTLDSLEKAGAER